MKKCLDERPYFYELFKEEALSYRQGVPIKKFVKTQEFVNGLYKELFDNGNWLATNLLREQNRIIVACDILDIEII